MSKEHMNQPQKVKPNDGTRDVAKPDEHPLMQMNSSNLVTQITAMQGIIGNQAVMRFLNKQQNTVQRVDTGLRRGSSTTGFAGKAARWAKANGDKTLAEFATQLITYVNIELAKTGVPRVTLDLGAAAGTLGEFDFTPWTIQINPGSLSPSGAADVSGMTDDEIAEVANTIYHESRHAEQWFRIARLLAGEGKTAKAIGEETGIENTRVLSAAESDPLKDPGVKASELKQEMYAEAKAWHKSVYGADADYRGLTFAIGETADNLASLLDQAGVDGPSFTANEAAIDDEVDDLNNTHQPELQDEKTRIEAIASPSAVENTMVAHIDEQIRLIGEIDAEWSATVDETNVPNVEVDVNSLNAENYQAYHDLPEEDDAHDVGDAAGAEAKTNL